MGWNSKYRVAGRINMGTGHHLEPLSERKKREQKELDAMASVNLVMLVGNLGGDPELKYTSQGKPFCKFSLATTDEWKDARGVKHEKTEWHRITIWGPQAETSGKELAKGSTVYIEGKIQTSKTEDRGQTHYWTEIKVDKIRPLASSSRGSQPPPDLDPPDAFRYEDQSNEETSFRHRNA